MQFSSNTEVLLENLEDKFSCGATTLRLLTFQPHSSIVSVCKGVNSDISVIVSPELSIRINRQEWMQLQSKINKDSYQS